MCYPRVTFSIWRRRSSAEASGFATCTSEAPAANTAKQIVGQFIGGRPTGRRHHAVVASETLCGSRGLGTGEDLGHRPAVQRGPRAGARAMIWSPCTRTDVA